jgi:hypothetical protein
MDLESAAALRLKPTTAKNIAARVNILTFFILKPLETKPPSKHQTPTRKHRVFAKT